MEKTAFGEGLAAARKRKLLSIHRLAELAGLSRETIRKIESGASSPTLATVQKLLHPLGARLKITWSGR